MILKTFHVTKFRNIVDSTLIYVDENVTCLVGKNEAGKSALIEALSLINPAYDDTMTLARGTTPKYVKFRIMT